VIKSSSKLIVIFLRYGHLSVTVKPTLIISTYPDKKSITKIAKLFVKNKTVACVNISKISSIYSWNKKIENTSEYIAIFKTTSKNKKLLKEKIRETHPYDVPEIAEIDVTSINKSYLDWLVDSTS
jgi:periplasmic divalent cation tolerance protein